jgi:hypothetical protein
MDAVRAGAALCLLWVSACATDSVIADEAPVHGAGWEEEGPAEAAGLGFTPEGAPERLDSAQGAHRGAREAEAARVVRELWDLAGARGVPGERWRFEYQARGGALTLLAFHRVSGGHGREAREPAWSAFERELRGLATLVGEAPKRITFTLECGARGWDIGLETGPASSSPSVRALPVVPPRVSEAARLRAMQWVRELLLSAPLAPGGEGRLEARARYEGAALTGLEFDRWTKEREAGSRVGAAEDSVAHVVDALLPFTQGVGLRTVTLSLAGTYRDGEREARWRVVEARTLEPEAPPKALEDISREYRAMHEGILRDWRAGVVDSAKLAGVWSFEQLAYWFVGGVVAKGAVKLVGATAPTVSSVLSRGGRQAVQWFRTVLLRAPAAEREALQRLWLKAETQGLVALTPAEVAELQSLMRQVETRLRTPLNRYAKKKLREWAREEYFTVINPRLAKELGNSSLDYYAVHHRVPLEFAQLFPKADVNASANLIGVEVTVHKSISRVWESLGQQAQRLSGAQVEKIAAAIDAQYGRWYHVVYNPSQSASALAAAEKAALQAVKTLIAN